MARRPSPNNRCNMNIILIPIISLLVYLFVMFILYPLWTDKKNLDCKLEKIQQRVEKARVIRIIGDVLENGNPDLNVGTYEYSEKIIFHGLPLTTINSLIGRLGQLEADQRLLLDYLKAEIKEEHEVRRIEKK